MNGNAAEIGALSFALAAVESCPDLDAQRAYLPRDAHCTADRPAGSIKSNQETISCCVHLPPTESRQLPSYDDVVLLQQLSPVPITYCCRPSCGVDNIGEEDRRQNSIWLRAVTDSREEFLDLVEKRVRISHIGCMSRSDQLNEFGSLDGLGHVTCLVDSREPVTASVQNQGRYIYDRKNVTDVDLHVHPHDGYRSARTRREPHISPSPLFVGLVADDAWTPYVQREGRTTPVLLECLQNAVHSLAGDAARMIRSPRPPRV